MWRSSEEFSLLLIDYRKHMEGSFGTKFHRNYMFGYTGSTYNRGEQNCINDLPILIHININEFTSML